MSRTSPRIEASKLPFVAGVLAAVTLLVVVARLVISAQTPAPAQQSTAPRTPPAVVRVASAVAGPISEVFSYAGAVQATNQVSLVPRTSGIVATIPVDVGTTINAGQVLATLDPGTLPDQLVQAQSGLDQAEAKLQQLLAQGRPDDIAAANAQLAQAPAKLSGLVAQGRPEDIVAAQQALGAAQAKLDQMITGGRPEAVAAAQAALDSANAKLTQTLIGPTDDVREAARDAVNADQAVIAAAQATFTNVGDTSSSDIRAAQAAVNADQAAFLQAQDAMTNLPATFPSDLTSAQSAYDASVMQLNTAQTNLNTTRSQLGGGGGVTATQVPSLQATAAQAQAAYDQAQSNLTTLQLGASTGSSSSASTFSSASVCSRDPNTHNVANPGACTAAMTAANSSLTAAQQALTNAQTQLDAAKQGPTPEQIQAQLMLLQQQLEVAQSNAASARSRLDTLATGGIQMRQSELQSSLASAQQKLAADQTRSDALQASGIAAQQSTAQSQLTAAQEKLKSDQAHLTEILSEPKPEDLAVAQAAVDQARQALALAGQPSSPEDIRSQQALVDQARAQLLKAEQPNTADDIRQQQEAVAQLQAQAQKAWVPNSADDIKVAQTAVDQARAQVAVAQSSLDQMVLTAPFDGVVGQKLLAVGAFASANTPILTLSGHGLEVHVTMEEARVAAVEPGQAVQLTVPAYPDEQFSGRVVTVAPTGDPRAHTFDVTIYPDVADPRLMGGMYAQVQVTAAQKDSAVLVPREAIVQQQTGSVVFVVGSDNKAEQRQVQLGLSDDNNQEITSGIQPGDQVVTQGQNNLKAGQSIVVARPANSTASALATAAAPATATAPTPAAAPARVSAQDGGSH